MRIYFHPSFDTGYYVDWDKGAPKLGTKIVGLAGLLDYLSLHNGMSGRFVSDGERAAAYQADVDRCTKGTWLETPFLNDKLGVTKRLLEWRDLLIMAGWTPELGGTEETPKIQLLSHIEESWKSRMKGTADRWLELARLSATKPLLGEDDQIICTCAKGQLPLLVRNVLEACGARFPEDLENCPDDVRIPEDLKVNVLHFNDLLDAYRQVAAGKLNDGIIINRDNVSLNHVLFAWGKPLLDATIQDSNPLPLQLFKLALSVFSRPLNIQNLLSYFQLPVGPIPTRLRTALARILVSDGGFSPEWDQAILEYAEDKEQKSRHSREERESRLCFLRPITDEVYSSDGMIPVKELEEYIRAINKWAEAFAFGKKDNEEGIDDALKSQLGTVISCFKQLLEVLKGLDSISCKELEKQVNAIYQPISIVQARAQVGSLRVVNSLQQFLDTPDSVIWLDCCEADAIPDRYDFLSSGERTWLNGQAGICVPDLKDLLDWNRKEMITTLAKVKGGITLVSASYHHNRKLTEHPFLAELKMQRGDGLTIREGSTDLPRSKGKPVLTFEPKAEYKLGSITYQGRSESNTSIDTLINYPFDYAVHYVAQLGEPSRNELGTIRKATGLVAHLFIQNLINDVLPLHDRDPLEAISCLIKSEFDTRLEKAVRSTGLSLLLKENAVEYANLQFLLKRSIETLVKIMKHEKLTPVGCELKYDGPVFSDGEFNARIDMELKDANGRAVIFDFKWTYSSFYGEKIKDGTSVQLELYRKELEKQGKTVRATGYYILPKCVLETSDFDTLKDAETNQVIIRHIDPPADSTLFDKIQNSVSQRLSDIKNGNIEEGEEMDIKDLPYSAALIEGRNLLPVGTRKTARPSKSNPDPPVEAINKSSNIVFVNKPESRFLKSISDFENNPVPKEKPTTYPLLKGRLK